MTLLDQSPTVDESFVTKGETKVQSCFLPDTQVQVAWDSTSLGLFKTCPRLYQYVMIDGWASRDESVHLRFGIEYHKALEDFDKSRAAGIPHDDAVHDVIRALHTRVWDWATDLETKAGRYKNKHTIIKLVIDYLDHFKDDPASTYILGGGEPAVELSFRFELDWGPRAALEQIKQEHPGYQKPEEVAQPYLLSGHLDRVVSFNDSLFVMDRKTTTTTPGSYYFNQFEPNNQMTLYTLAGKVVLSSPIKGVIIDAAQVLLESPNRFVRGITYRTQDQLDEWMEDLSLTLSIAESHATNGYWPMNDMSCGMYGGCRFREVCSKSPQVREMFLKSNFDKLEPSKRWNPLVAR